MALVSLKNRFTSPVMVGSAKVMNSIRHENSFSEHQAATRSHLPPTRRQAPEAHFTETGRLPWSEQSGRYRSPLWG
jgi:hypothetical protein